MHYIGEYQKDNGMKHEWRKKEKALYLPKSKPELVNVKDYQFISIQGEGNPNNEKFAECIGILYSVSYAIKMNLKKNEVSPKNYVDYTVYPLEGVWDITEEAKKSFTGQINKDELVFDLMIRQPDFVSKVFFEEMRAFCQNKKTNSLLDKLEFKTIAEGPCIQMLHVGSYDNEAVSFKQMEEFASARNLKRKSKVHREIYLSDFRKVAEEKLKTVLRFQLA